MKKILLIFMLSARFLNAEQNDLGQDDPVNVQVTIKNKLTNETSDKSCEKFHDRELVNCILCTPAHERTNEIKQLPAKKKKEFLLSLAHPEYKQLLKNMTQEEWQQIYESLPEEWQETGPATVEEQLNELKSIESSAEYADTGSYVGALIVETAVPGFFLVTLGIKGLCLLTVGHNPLITQIKEHQTKKYIEKSLP